MARRKIKNPLIKSSPSVKPGFHEYLMGIALAVRARANCKGRHVGAVLAMDERVISTGYNGTPRGMKNCEEGGCYRCDNREKRFGPGTAYDICICVHAEQNALLAAARFGVPSAGAAIFTTHQPCFGCAKELLQAGVKEVYYVKSWVPDDKDLARQYRIVLDRFDRVQRLSSMDFDESK
jgi:dCMP deaminase